MLPEMLADILRGILLDFDVPRIVQTVSQDDGVLPPANLYGQLLGVVINLVVAGGGAAAFWVTQRTSRMREAANVAREKAARIERERIAREVSEKAEKIARDLADTVERERISIATVVKEELELARGVVQYQAQQTESNVRHDVRNELAQQRLEIQQLQKQLAERVDAKLEEHGMKADAAYSEANSVNSKIASLRDDFNAILGRDGDRDERTLRADEQADRIELTGDDTNVRVREGLTPGENERLRRGLETDGR